MTYGFRAKMKKVILIGARSSFPSAFSLILPCVLKVFHHSIPTLHIPCCKGSLSKISSFCFEFALSIIYRSILYFPGRQHSVSNWRNPIVIGWSHCKSTNNEWFTIYQTIWKRNQGMVWKIGSYSRHSGQLAQGNLLLCCHPMMR